MDKSPTNYRHGHRARLREKFLSDKLAEYELLELLLSYAIPRKDVKPIAHGLLRVFGNIHDLLCAPVERLESVPGVGASAAVLIKVAREIILIDYENTMKNTPIFVDYKAFENYCRMKLSGKLTEEFHVLYLDKHRQLIKAEIHSKGAADYAEVYPIEIAKRAVALNAKCVALIHNHPSRLTSFSDSDKKATEVVIQKLDALGIEFFDHFVVSGGIVHSIKNTYAC
ncbi:MAG: DNA repair protein RadC [Alphaproteobacteria bacterium]|nr:DNA repair protein RadC [Alphaproteobacteria bacterium]